MAAISALRIGCSIISLHSQNGVHEAKIGVQKSLPCYRELLFLGVVVLLLVLIITHQDVFRAHSAGSIFECRSSRNIEDKGSS